ncbi:hypothetical protein CC2G_010166 [Coprinopsis cinerea AmutBmut pab1-1]|nr:hypothetical protein CC2G_010166 [Coprinopsis cinerea AmutBmut pab1-1]
MAFPTLTTSKHYPSLNVGGQSTSRSFHLPRIKAAAALLRHGQSNVNELRSQNSLQPISRLPENLLRRIFALVASSTIGRAASQLPLLPPRGRNSGSSPWSWVVLTHVCHSWRSIALSDIDLWRHVDFSHPKWLNITLSRAKMQPLDIRAEVGRHNIEHLHRTLQLAHRIGSIEIDSSLHHIHVLLSSLAHPNPHIRSITVRVNTAGHGVEDSVYDEPAFPMVGPALPEMTYLELHSAPFYLVSGRYTSLTNLHLYDFTPCQRPTLQQFIHALSRYPNLEHLTLDNAFPLASNSVPFPRGSPTLGSHSPSLSSSPLSRAGSPTTSPPAEARLQITHLRTLRLSGSITDIAAILDAVFLPPDIKISCRITSLADWEQSIWRLSQALKVHSYAAASAGRIPDTVILSGLEEQAYPSIMASMSPHGNSCTIQGARIYVYTRLTRERHGSPSPGHSGRRRTPSPSSAASQPNLWLDLSIGPDHSHPSRSTEEEVIRNLSNVWSALPVSKVHTLVLHDLDFITQKTWTHFLKDLPSLRVVDIAGHAPSGFVWALLLNANACVQREAKERERKEKRERKAMRTALKASRAASASPVPIDDLSNSPPSLPLDDGQISTISPSSSPPPLTLPLSPISPLSPVPVASRKLFIPNLRDIYIRNVDCSSGGYMMAPDAPVNSLFDLDDSRFLDVLYTCLQARVNAQERPVGSPNSRTSLHHPARDGSTGHSPSSSSSSSPRPVEDVTRLRSLTISNCRFVSKRVALDLRKVVSHLMWDQRGMVKGDQDASGGVAGCEISQGRRWIWETWFPWHNSERAATCEAFL